ncbi:MAG: methylated-DNA--[protein]-cysteine S-methyltransferase [Planctomycetota bacterium]
MNYLLKTRLGWCGIVFDGNVVKEIVLPSPDKKRIVARLKERRYISGKQPEQTPLTKRFLKTLSRYFNGEKVDFGNPARYISGLTRQGNFTKAVYKALMTIPYGQVRTYQWVAKRVGNPGASRAVGNALARNSLPVIIPCHRVIKSDGSLGNFSAIGGTELKEKLLKMEGVR